MKTFIGNLRLAHKFLLIGLIAALMLTVPSALIVRVDIDKLTMAQAEVTGLAPAGDTIRLLQLTQQHRGMSAALLSGNDAIAAQRQSKQAEVDAAMARLQKSAPGLGDAKLTALTQKLVEQWQSLAQAVSDRSLPVAQSFARHTELVAGLLDLLEDVSNASGIVLHPEAAGYFLQKAVLSDLPRLTEVLGQIRARGTVILTRGSAGPEEKSALSALVLASRTHLGDARKALDLSVAGHDELGRQLGSQIGASVDAIDEALKLVNEKVLNADTLNFPAASFFDASTRIIDQQFKLIDTAMESLDRLLRDDAAHARQELLMVLGTITLMSAICIIVMWGVTRVTTGSVGAALKLAESVAAGDLATNLPGGGRDEIGQLLRALGVMNDSLVRVVAGVRQNAESIATASAQIAQGNLDLSRRTEEQASALAQTAATMAQLSTTVEQNAGNARQASELAQTASTVAVHGGGVVDEVVDTMKEIQESSTRIADIISVIDGIAFQTNLLALNAAVEAARAGEMGSGFAVVAAEVRNLAQRSAEAAKEIKGLIDAGAQRVAHGTTLVGQAGTTMRDVVTAIQRVTGIMTEISSASAEQSTGVNQVGESVNQMDQVTQQNAALVEQSAAAAQCMKDQAVALVREVAVFKLDPAQIARALAAGDGQASPAGPSARPQSVF